MNEKTFKRIWAVVPITTLERLDECIIKNKLEMTMNEIVRASLTLFIDAVNLQSQKSHKEEN